MAFDKLPIPFKKKWVEKLRSGTWRKTKGLLREKNKSGGYSYCVLGTAAAMLGAKEINGGALHAGSIGMETFQKVPCTLREHSPAASALMGMNDDGKSFKKLADWIDKNL